MSNTGWIETPPPYNSREHSTHDCNEQTSDRTGYQTLAHNVEGKRSLPDSFGLPGNLFLLLANFPAGFAQLSQSRLTERSFPAAFSLRAAG